MATLITERDIDHVIIAARGTSDNAGRYAQYVLGAMNGLTVGLATPSLFSIYNRPPRFGNALVLGISQSGKSPDIVAVLAEAKRQGALTAAMTNNPASDLAAASRCGHRSTRREGTIRGGHKDLHGRTGSDRLAEHRADRQCRPAG